MFIWLIPTIGLLVELFRPLGRVTDSGWWTALFAADRAHARQLPARPQPAGIDSRVHQQPVHHDPGHGHPGHGRGVRGLRVRVDDLPGPRHPVRHRRRAARRPAPDDAHPGPASCTAPNGFKHHRHRSWRSGWPTPATACRSRSTCSATTSAACPREVFESAAIDGASPSTAFFRLALPMSVPAHRGPGDLPVPVGLERPARRSRLPRDRSPENLPLTVGHRRTSSPRSVAAGST